ncbi:hypothetical protein ACHAXT_012220 [Thalassiosira profunda]
MRRASIASILALVPFLGWRAHEPPSVAPPPAHALQEKNELLCGTGFFTNVGAWYCTDIGNIGDEGRSKPMSGEAAASVDSLMGKFDLEGGDFGEGKGGESKRQSSRETRGDVNDVTAMDAKE